MRIHTHPIRTKQVVVAIGGITAIFISGVFMSPQQTNALSLPEALNYIYSHVTPPPITTNTSSTSKTSDMNLPTTVTPARVNTVTPIAVTPTPASALTVAPSSSVTQSTPAPSSSPAAAQTPATTQSPQPASQNNTTTPTQPVIVPIDTAAQASATANAQALGSSSKVMYVSHKMDPAIATNIYKAAGIASLIAVLMIAATGFKTTPSAPLARRQNILSHSNN